LDPKERDKVHTVANGANAGQPYALGDTPGRGLFQKACAACHTIGQGIRIGPDLAGVTARRERDWLQRFIARPSKMLADKDPTALALAEKFRGLTMPNIGLSENDVGDVLSYLETQTRRIEARQIKEPSSASNGPGPAQSQN
jgi:putative heme-binding domain-containing protein